MEVVSTPDDWKNAPRSWRLFLASVIDLNMVYLSIPLCKKSRKPLAITTQYRFFESCVLPMGIKPASDIFQSWMAGVFQPMENRRPTPFIDGIFHGKGNMFEEHLTILAENFWCLLDSGMQVNLDKSTLCTKSVKFLGFDLGQKDSSLQRSKSKQFSS